MLRSSNVATPATADRVLVPLSVAPAAPVPAEIATVRGVFAVVTVFPWASWMVTRTAGLMAAPAVTGLGCPVTASAAGVPATAVAANVTGVIAVAAGRRAETVSSPAVGPSVQ